MGHFASECRESKQADDRKRDFQKKDSGSKKKYPVKSYIAEGKNWDDTDDEEEHGNMALMAGDWDPTYGYEVKPTCPMIWLKLLIVVPRIV